MSILIVSINQNGGKTRAKFYNGTSRVFIITYLSLILERPYNRIKLQISEALAAMLPVMRLNILRSRRLNKHQASYDAFRKDIKKRGLSLRNWNP